MDLTFLKNVSPFFVDTVASTLGLYTNDKNQILDPITTSVRLTLLMYKPLYTKLSIGKNRISFQEPTLIPLIQGFLRRAKGDQRSDIHIIILSIENLLHWYKITDKKIRYICDGVINGLEKLSKCYSQEKNTNIVSQAIDFFIEKIKRELGEIVDTSEDNDSNKSDFGLDSILSDKFVENNINYDYFKSHWNGREIRIIYDQLKELEIDKNEGKRASIIQSIENFLTYKDENTYKYMTNLTKYN
jgi:hypothetical protein